MARSFVLTAALALASLPALAVTVGPGCTVGWDYPSEELSRIDGFRLYVDNVAALDVPAAEQTAPCSDLITAEGLHTLEATAFNAVGESARSNALEVIFVQSAPAAPRSLQLIIGAL